MQRKLAKSWPDKLFWNEFALAPLLMMGNWKGRTGAPKATLITSGWPPPPRLLPLSAQKELIWNSELLRVAGIVFSRAAEGEQVGKN